MENNLFYVLASGIIQGLTEFLPISSSGHLVIAQNILGVNSPGNTLEVLFHFGTLMSVFYVFFEDLKQILLKINHKISASKNQNQNLQKEKSQLMLKNP